MLHREFRPAGSEPVAYLGGSVWLPPHTPNANRGFRHSSEPRIALTDRAPHVVTDFSWEQPLTIAEDRPINEALLQMMLVEVGALLVVQPEVLTGLITSDDIQGERSLQYLLASNLTRYDEIEVRHIMTPWESVPTLDWRVVQEAYVSDIVRFFRGASATHVVIIEYGEQGGTFACGLISRARLRRQLGHAIDP
jgi:hypothetical protein